MKPVITLSLISHTNVGKTTLARTLLRRDIGQVLDQAHVTEESEAYALVETDEATLSLWDTPGLGDSARLVSRLQNERNPLGWFLHQVWDRNRDRALFCSQKAARNIREEADVVLYLVNASENPEHAGYVPHEMELLEWMGKPVLVLLNQTGAADDEEEAARQLGRWREALRKWAVVREIITLDAFTRCWVQEGVLLQRVVELLPDDRRAAMEALRDAWITRNADVFDTSVVGLGVYLALAARDREAVEGQGFGQTEKRRAMRVLAQRLDDTTRELMDSLIGVHGLQGRYRTEVRERLEADFDLPGEVAWSSGGTTILGAAMGGAAGGLAADVLVAGLSFGGGAVAGAILGAAGAAGLRKGYQFVRGGGAPEVRWAWEFLEQLARQAMLRYVAIAHFGRGRGEWRETGNPERWNSLVEDAIAKRGADLSRVVAALRDEVRSEESAEDPVEPDDSAEAAPEPGSAAERATDAASEAVSEPEAGPAEADDGSAGTSVENPPAAAVEDAPETAAPEAGVDPTPRSGQSRGALDAATRRLEGDPTAQELVDIVRDCLRDAFSRAYPEAAHFLERPDRPS